MLTNNNPTLADLFSQLGLGSTDTEIAGFIDKHKGLDAAVHIEHAPFWNASQKAFLCFELEEDAEWAEVIDQLNNALR